jgi:hypothetical protein
MEHKTHEEYEHCTGNEQNQCIVFVRKGWTSQKYKAETAGSTPAFLGADSPNILVC